MGRIAQLIQKLCPDGVPYTDLSNLCKIETGKLDANAATPDGKYHFFTTAKEISRINSFRWDTEALLIAGNANVGDVKHYIGKFDAYQRTYVLTDFKSEIIPRFMFHIVLRDLKTYLSNKTNSAAMTYIVLGALQNFQVPIPPIEVQQEIVSILDKFTQLEAELEAELENRKRQYSSYKEKLMLFSENDAQILDLQDVCLSISAGGDVPKDTLKGQRTPTSTHPYPVYSNGNDESALYGFSSTFKFAGEAVTISARGTIGSHSVRTGKFTPIIRLITLIPNPEIITPEFLDYYFDFLNLDSTSGGIPQLTVPAIKKIRLKVPSIQTQVEISKKLSYFKQLVEDKESGLPAEIAARRKQYEYYRDKLLTFKELDAA